MTDDEQFSKSVTDHFAGRLAKDMPIRVGENFPVLKVLGVKPLPVVINPSVLDRARDKHEIGVASIEKLPSEIRDPVMVFDSATQKGRLVVLTSLKNRKGQMVVAAIEPEKKTYLHHLRITNVVSLNKRSAEEIQRWIDARLLRYLHTKKSLTLAGSTRLQLPQVNRPQSDSAKTILTEADIVNPEWPSAGEIIAAVVIGFLFGFSLKPTRTT